MKSAYQISVIVPVYNAEKYLKRAMDSLIAQTVFTDLEVIAVDDGSTDQSGAILDSFSVRYPNVLVYHIANGGVSNARNFGMEQASGEHIGFLDADDWVDPDFFENMLSRIKDGKADIAVCGFSMEADAGTVVTNNVPVTADVYSGAEAVKAFLLGEIDVHAVTKLYRADLVRDVRFDSALHYGEDRLFALDALLRAERVVSVDGCCYHYYLNTQSAMHQELSERSFENLIVGRRTVVCVRQRYPELAPYAECEEISTKCRLLGEIVLQNRKEQYPHYYRQLRKDIREYDLAKAYRYSSRKHFLSLLIARISPGLYGRLRSVPILRFHKSYFRRPGHSIAQRGR